MACVLSILKLISPFVLLASTLVEVNGVWTCAKHCEARFDGPKGKDYERLEKVQSKLALAEMLWHYHCVELDELELMAERDDHKCDPGPELKAKIVPGAKEMQYGYNIVTAKYTLPKLMDLVSRTGNATVFDRETNTCFALPDAFTPKQDVIYSGGTFTTSEFRPDHNLIWKLDGYKNGQVNLNDKNVPKFWWSTVTHRLVLWSPMPTPELVSQWKILFGTAAGVEQDDAFVKYFNSFGTHYFRAASIGGELSVRVAPRQLEKNPTREQIEAWSNCVAEMLSQVFIRGKDGAGRAVQHRSQDCSSQSDLVRQFSIICTGGDETKCPQDLELSPDQVKRFSAWKASVRNKVGPIDAYIRPVTNLIEKVLDVADESSRAQSVLSEIGGVDALTKFGELLHGQLVKYLVSGKYCKTVDECQDLEATL